MQNEVFFDIYEDIDCVIDTNGAVVRNDIRGTVQCKCNLSGVPDLALFFTEPRVRSVALVSHVATGVVVCTTTALPSFRCDVLLGA